MSLIIIGVLFVAYVVWLAWPEKKSISHNSKLDDHVNIFEGTAEIAMKLSKEEPSGGGFSGAGASGSFLDFLDDLDLDGDDD